jgi:hypothetical protein
VDVEGVVLFAAESAAGADALVDSEAAVFESLAGSEVDVEASLAGALLEDLLE